MMQSSRGNARLARRTAMYRLSGTWMTALLLAAAAPWVPFAFAQTSLGAVLDAGGRRISGEEFKRDVVGKVMRGTGSTPTGVAAASAGSGTVELVYLSAGGIRGMAQLATLSTAFGRPGGGASFGVEGS